MQLKIVGVENTGHKNAAQFRRAEICEKGNCGTISQGVENAGHENERKKGGC